MADTSEARLIEKLRAIEALHARPGTSAEGQAAANARERILQRLAEVSAEDVPVEYRFSMPDMWSRRLFGSEVHDLDVGEAVDETYEGILPPSLLEPLRHLQHRY